MPNPTDEIQVDDVNDDDTCEDSAVWPVLITASSVLLGDFMGRISYRLDLRTAMHRIEESSEPIEISIRTL